MKLHLVFSSRHLKLHHEQRVRDWSFITFSSRSFHCWTQFIILVSSLTPPLVRKPHDSFSWSSFLLLCGPQGLMGGSRTWSHSSSSLERHFSSGPPEETPPPQHASPPSGCSVLPVFRWVFPANQGLTSSTSPPHSPPSICLSTALVATAAELTQDQLSLTATIGGEASFSCGGTDQYNYIIWFQKKDTGTFTLILDIDTSDGQIDRSYNHPQKDDFTAERQQNSCELKIKKVKPSHAATYYCAPSDSGTHSDTWCVQPEQKPVWGAVGERSKPQRHMSPLHPTAALHLLF